MIVSVVLPADKLEKVKQCLDNQKSAGIKFEYFTDTNEVFMLIKERGFYMDKLVLISSFLVDFNDADRQILVDNLADTCETYLTDNIKEILMIDSGKLFETEYHRFFDPYPQFIYQTQKIHPTQLFGLIAGNFVEEENPNIDNEVTKPNFFSRVFGKRKQEAPSVLEEQTDNIQENQEPSTVQEAEKDYSDVPLFANDAETSVANEEIVDNSNDCTGEDDDNWDFDFDESELNAVDDSSSKQEYSDTPLFEESKEDTISEAVDHTADAPRHVQNQQKGEIKTQKTTVDIESKPTAQEKDIIKPKSPFSKKVQRSIDDVVSATAKPKKQKNKSYVDFFQKRSKIVLFTGDRRMGTSTVVANLADQASHDGLQVLLLDLDFERRGQAINFPITCDENDVKTILSLYHAIKNAANIDDYAIRLNDNLDYLGTSLAADSTDFMVEHVTDDALRSLLSIALGKYDLVLIDCPFRKLKYLTCLIGMSNCIVHSIQTDTRSIINAINMLTPEDFANQTDYSVYMSKLMLLLNMFKTHFWNSTEINEKSILRYMINLTDDDMYSSLCVLGRIPEFHDYDEFMDNGNLLVMNSKYQDIFIGLLNDLAAKG